MAAPSSAGTTFAAGAFLALGFGYTEVISSGQQNVASITVLTSGELDVLSGGFGGGVTVSSGGLFVLPSGGQLSAVTV